ncbi:MAG: hypothetical protein ABW142_00060, partial [Thermoleophilaceae bacterium]
MIPPEQLAGALERLDPRERELLALSLGRRVPDEALARVYDVVPQEIARRRAAAIERLADELGAQRGEDLGAVLQALLDEGSWTASKDTELAATAAAAGNGDAPPQEGEAEATAGSEAEEEAAESNGQPAVDGEPAADVDGAAVAVEDGAPVVPVPTEPVLEMLAAREGVRVPGADEEDDGEAGSRRGVVAIAIASFVAAVIGGAAAFVGLSHWDDNGGGGPSAAQPPNEGMKHFVPQLGGPFEAPFPSDP